MHIIFMYDTKLGKFANNPNTGLITVLVREFGGLGRLQIKDKPTMCRSCQKENAIWGYINRVQDQDHKK